jgi:hypothetical protein
MPDAIPEFLGVVKSQAALCRCQDRQPFLGQAFFPASEPGASARPGREEITEDCRETRLKRSCETELRLSGRDQAQR